MEEISDYEGPTCIAHSVMPDEDCDYCTAEIASRKEHYEAIITECNKRGDALTRRQGQIDPTSLLDLRQNMLLDVIFQNNERGRLTFETEFAKRLHHTLGEALSAITQAQLLQDAQQGQGIIDPRQLRRI